MVRSSSAMLFLLTMIMQHKACQADCTVPTTAGYVFTSAGGVVTFDGNFAPTGVTCATGFSAVGDTITYTACTSDNAAYTVAGCEAPCTVPSTAGYDFSSAAGDVTWKAFAPTGVTCNTGFSAVGDTITYAKCSSGGNAYTVTGCQAPCIAPSTTGYVFTSAGGDLTWKAFAPTGVTCAADYTAVGDTITYTKCTSGTTAYTVAGCQTDCIAPTTANYVFTSAGGVLTNKAFAPTGVTCGTGYSGTVTYTKCTSGGGAYSVAGCEADCTRPSTAGYDFTGGSLSETLAFAGDTFAVTGVTCATGYTGSSVTATKCTSAGTAYSVTGCTQQTNCIRPTTTTGYDLTGGSFSETLAFAGDTFAVSGVTCASGYSGTASATKCASAGAAYSLSGCTQGDATPTPAPATPAPASNTTNSTAPPSASVDDAMPASMISMSAVFVAACAFSGV